MKVYIGRDTGSEFYASDLYEDYGTWETDTVEAEISETEWAAANKTIREYWMWQDKLCALYEKGKKEK